MVERDSGAQLCGSASPLDTDTAVHEWRGRGLREGSWEPLQPQLDK